MKLVLQNQSTLVSDADAATIAVAVQTQLAQVAQQWGLARPDFDFQPGDPNAVPVVLLDDSSQAGALGYHDETPDGKPYARVFCRDSIAGLAGVDPASLTGVQPSDVVFRCVAPVVSHEALETLGDEHVDDWAQAADGTLYAVELADACESSSYPIDVNGVAVLVSDYLLPAYFDPTTQVGAQVDEMAVIQTGPFTIAKDGYAITQQGGTINQTFGDELALWRKAQHEQAHPASRTGKRLASLAHPVENAELGDVGVAPDLVAVVDGSDPELAASILAHPTSARIVQDNVSTPGVQVTTDVLTGEESTHEHAVAATEA